LVAVAAFPARADELRRAEKRLDLSPHQLVEIGSVHLRRRAAFWSSSRDVVDAPPAVVVGVTSVRVGDHGCSANPAADQATQQVLVVALEIPAGECFVLLQLLLHAGESLLVDDGWNGNRNPLVSRPHLGASLAGLPECAVGAGAFNPAAPVVVGNAGVGLVGEDGANGRGRPVIASAAGLPWRSIQPHRDLSNRQLLVCHPGEQVANHRYLFLVDLPAARLGTIPAHVSVAEGRLADDHCALTGPVELAPPCAFGDLGALVLGDDTLNLHQQLALGTLSRHLIQEDHVTPKVLELVHQDHLMGVAPGEAIWRVDVDHVDRSFCSQVPQAVEARPVEVRAAAAVVEQNVLVVEHVVVLSHPGTQVSQLRLDRRLLLLSVRGHPCINRRSSFEVRRPRASC